MLLVKLTRSPRTIAILLFDRFLVPIWMRLNRIQTGRRCRFVGQPVLNLAAGARVSLGDDVLVNSRFDSNPAGLPHPTIFAALESNSRIEIGDGTGISGASIVARSVINIGKRVLIGAGACIWDTDFHPLEPDLRRQHSTRAAKCAPITIEDEVFIGARSIILKGVSIGRGAVIGAGTVVTRDVRAGDIVAGNPARRVGARITQQENGEFYENASVVSQKYLYND
jgi:acetyltransferase-like isoleucine patch superfamily enzyme